MWAHIHPSATPSVPLVPYCYHLCSSCSCCRASSRRVEWARQGRPCVQEDGCTPPPDGSDLPFSSARLSVDTDISPLSSTCLSLVFPSDLVYPLPPRPTTHLRPLFNSTCPLRPVVVQTDGMPVDPSNDSSSSKAEANETTTTTTTTTTTNDKVSTSGERKSSKNMWRKARGIPVRTRTEKNSTTFGHKKSYKSTGKAAKGGRRRG